MKQYNWSDEKNKQLIKERGVSFERVVVLLDRGDVLDVIEQHPNQKRYPGQRMFILKINNYCYLVPFVENEKEVFLKTIVPSRKATRKYGVKDGKGKIK
jgi:uncharacterized DUF497 family protein